MSVWTPRILTPDTLPAIDRGGGARTIPLVTRETGATSFLNGVTEFAPGASIAHHSHNCVESVMIIEGSAIVDIDGVRTRLGRHDTTFVPANIAHHFENASPSEPMAIFWTYASVDATRRVDATGEVRRVDGEAGAADEERACRETARVRVRPGAEAAFESAATEAAGLFQQAAGCRSFELRRLLEEPSVYLLCIEWDSVADHLDRFRGSAAYSRWRELVRDLIVDDPEVAHDRLVIKGF
ncbi:cupin domain-containing protein [Microbacterium horticulturae]|uniref:Cupin domain-containing protein n=1 Tax=Microbacterium horticulturae TaxID=3028316 RepID=A0ABY8BZI2_9MICO|nr:antibiotic biosynthesis monooxygenase [Microbacterium sp. KACC 23027]WEG08008.1 cupin domain-containing protein [Microbacterium sp. KACC 23027]